MIKSFKCKETEKIFTGVFSRKFPADIQTRAFNKLAALHAAFGLTDLKAPPSNHPEELKGDRAGQYSIRINDNTVSASIGTTTTPKMSRLLTIMISDVFLDFLYSVV
jgi:proteic killer suppression protein